MGEQKRERVRTSAGDVQVMQVDAVKRHLELGQRVEKSLLGAPWVPADPPDTGNVPV
jgi:hypothetical protein